MPKLRGKVRHSAERTDYQVSRNERLRRPRQVLVVQGRRLGREDFSQEPKVTEAFDMPLEHLPPPLSGVARPAFRISSTFQRHDRS